MPEGGAVLSGTGFHARVSAVLPVGGSDGWLLGAVENIEGMKAAPTQLVWVSLARNKIEGKQLLPPGEMVLDYHPPSHRLLSRAWKDPRTGLQRGGDEARPLTVWEVLPSDSSKSMSLFSLKHRAVLWSYQFSTRPGAVSGFGRVRELVRDHVAYSAVAGTGPGSGLVIGAVALPGPGVEEADATFDRESLVAIGPGSTIRLVVKAGENDARVQAALEAAIDKSGWVLDPDSTTVLTAEMGRKDSRQVTYYDSDKNPVETVTVTPYYSTATIEYDGKNVFQRGVGTYTPLVVFLEEGETVQEEIDRWEKPNVGFFDKLHLPTEIIHPEKRTGAGTTRVTNRGLIVASPQVGAESGSND